MAILASGGVSCRAQDSDFIMDATWNTQVLIRKAGEEEEGMGSVRKNRKEQPGNC